MAAPTQTRPSDPLGTRRWQVHRGLIVSFGVALFLVIARMNVRLHIVAGLCFAAPVGAHLASVDARCVRSPAASSRPRVWRTRRGRLALADGVLASTTPDGKTVQNTNSHGLAKFNPRGRVHEEELVKGKASAVIVELK